MELTKVPQILSQLVGEEKVNGEQKADILSTMDAMKAEGKRGFAGEIAIDKGFITRDSFNQSLDEQAAKKAEAAVKDIQEIASGGESLQAPGWLKANWGNNGVNPAAEEPTLSDAVSAASNVAQNIVLLANQAPEKAGELQESVIAAANLARGMQDGSSAKVPLMSKSEAWMETAKAGLVKAVQNSDKEPLDRNGAPVELKDFIAARFKEIGKGVDLSLERDQSKGKQQGVAA